MLARFCLFVAVAALVGLGLLLYARQWAPSRAAYPMQGVSVSADDGRIDWGTLAANGVDFAYIRAAGGRDFRDNAFARNWREARAAGVRYGASLDFSLCRRAGEQATGFVTTVPRDNAALPPVIRLAFDPSCTARPSRDGVLSELNTLVNLVESHSGKPALLNVAKDFDAAYDVASGINRTYWLDRNFFAPQYGPGKWVMWTANDMRHIDGIDGPVRWDVVAP